MTIIVEDVGKSQAEALHAFIRRMMTQVVKYTMDRTLKFNDMMVNTELAKIYLKEHDFKFGPVGFSNINYEDYSLDSQDNKIFNSDSEEKLTYSFNLFETVHDDLLAPVSTKLRKQMCDLANKIEENAELFSQLEYLIRGIPKDDVKFCDIKLISQNLLHCSSSGVPKFIESDFKTNLILMEENAPLAYLGFIAQMLRNTYDDYNKHDVRIVSGPETAVVCYLFTQLCHQVGLNQVTLLFPKEIENYEDKALNTETQPGGLGIITGRCDVDSALDAFLSSSARYPWSLQRILIQENVYESVKKIFAWKCKNSSTADAALNTVDLDLKSLCTDMFVHNEKLFLFEYVGDLLQTEASEKQVVLVEAYRTTKELLSLIKAQNPYSISLWCSDVSEANEIAFGADVRIVWVNDFGLFSGPPAMSQAFFSDIELDNTRCWSFHPIAEKDLAVLKKWSQLNVQMRIQKITNCLEKFKIENEDKKSIEFISKLEDSILNWKSDNFVDVQNGKLCVGRVVPLDLTTHFCKNDSPDLIMDMISGQGVVLVETSVETENMTKLLELFKKEGLPVSIGGSGYLISANSTEIKFGLNLSRTKVVWTDFGTIFAN